MTPLPMTFNKGGFQFVQVRRNESVAIYEQRGKDKVYAYEVVIIRQQAATELFGRFYEAHEVYPSTEQWGYLGRTFMTLVQAEEAFDSIVFVEDEEEAAA